MFLTSCISNAIARTSDDAFPTIRLQSLRVKKSFAILSLRLLASLRATPCTAVVTSSLLRVRRPTPSTAHPPPPVVGDVERRTSPCALLPDPVESPRHRLPFPSSLSSLSQQPWRCALPLPAAVHVQGFGRARELAVSAVWPGRCSPAVCHKESFPSHVWGPSPPAARASRIGPSFPAASDGRGQGWAERAMNAGARRARELAGDAGRRSPRPGAREERWRSSP
jgi:hypothetical protein